MKLKDLKCECGGHAEYVDNGPFIDQLKCTKCDYKTLTYFDGYEYAIYEWKKRRPAYCP